MYRTPHVYKRPSGWHYRDSTGQEHGPYKSRQAAHKAAREAGAV